MSQENINTLNTSNQKEVDSFWQSLEQEEEKIGGAFASSKAKLKIKKKKTDA